MQKSKLTIFSMLSILVFLGCKKKDTTLPEITVVGNASTLSVLNSNYIDQGASAIDNEDGELTSKIVIDNPVNKDSAAVYTITYTVQDAAGNSTSATRDVRVYNQAEIYAGAYSVVDETPYGNTPQSYTELISVSKSINKRLWVTTFGNQTGGKAYFDVNMSANTISVPSQTVICGNPSGSRVFGDPIGGSFTSSISTGTLTVIDLYYSHLYGSTQYNICKGTFTEQ